MPFWSGRQHRARRRFAAAVGGAGALLAGLLAPAATAATPVTVTVSASSPTVLRNTSVGLNNVMSEISDQMWSEDGHWMKQTYVGQGMSKIMRWGFGTSDWDPFKQRPYPTGWWWGGANEATAQDTFTFQEFIAYCKSTGTIPLIMVPWESQTYNGLPGVPLSQILATTHRMAQYVRDRGITNAEFEIGNEAYFGDQFYTDAAKPTPAFYADQLPDFWHAIKTVRSSFKVVVGMDSWNPAWDEALDKQYQYFDIVADHIYPSYAKGWASFYATNDLWSKYPKPVWDPAHPKPILLDEFNVVWPGGFASDLGGSLASLDDLQQAGQSNLFDGIMTWPDTYTYGGGYGNDSASPAYGVFDYYAALDGQTKVLTPDTLAHTVFNTAVLPLEENATSSDAHVPAYAYSDGDTTNVVLINEYATDQPTNVTVPGSADHVDGFTLAGQSITDTHPTYSALFGAGAAVTGSDFNVDLPAYSAVVLKFYRDNAAARPGHFATVSPHPDQSSVSSYQDFSWAKSAGATNYHLTVSTHRDLSAPVISQDVGDVTHFQDISTQLDSATRYYWQVTASNAAGARAGSVNAFTTARVAGVANHVVNSGFEHGGSPVYTAHPDEEVFSQFWTLSSDAYRVASDAHRGAYSVQLKGDGQSVTQHVFGLHPNMNYRLTGYVKTDGGAVSLSVAGAGSGSTGNGSYTKISVPFTTGANAYSADISCSSSGAVGQAYCDDLTVIRDR